MDGSAIAQQALVNNQGRATPLSFEVPILGSNQRGDNRLFFWLENTEGGHRDLYALSGLYDERSLHGSAGEFWRHVADRVALSELRTRL